MIKDRLITLIFWLLSATLFAQVKGNCPFNAVNCAFGCGRHIDLNNDGYCDHSILDFPDKTAVLARTDSTGTDTLKISSKVKPDKSKSNDSISRKKLNSPPEPVNVADSSNIPLTEKDKSEIQNPESTGNDIGKTELKPKTRIYNLIEVSAITFFLYFFTFFLSRRNLLRKIVHRRIWNTMLLLTFLVSCLFGFWLVIMINYQIAMTTFRTFLYWHVEIGVAMTLISVFHILWHLTYFKRLFNKPR